MRCVTWVGLFLLQACAVGPPAWTPAARLDPNSCATPSGTAAKPWRLVTGQGFTFCVPSDWQSSDGRTWRSGGAFVGWCTGNLPTLCPNVRYEITGAIITNSNQLGEAEIANEGGACSGDRSQEDVGGASAELGDWHCGGHHVTDAHWSVQALFFVGQTDDAVVAHLQLQVYRTVRFTSGMGISPAHR